jgi:predicted transcriptional regulator
VSKKIADSFSKLDQALKDLVESYASLVSELENKHGEEDEEALSAAIIEAIETSIEGAIDEQDSSTSEFAELISALSEALEQLDPSAFNETSEEEEDEDEDYGDDDDVEDLDEVEDEDEDDD